MSARFRTIKYTLTGSPVTLSSILNNANDEFVGSMTLRAGKDNVALITWTDAQSSDGGYLDQREAASWDLTGKYVKANQIYFTGTANDLLYITVIS